MREIRRPSLKTRTTLRLGGFALAELVLEQPEDYPVMWQRLSQLGGEPLYLGAGSNILARDGELPLVLARLADYGKPRIVGEHDGKILVAASAGMPMSRLLKFCLAAGLSGLEGLVGIPGTVGGCLAMNAGSFGSETGACAHEVLLGHKGALIKIQAEDIIKKYRHLSFRGINGSPMVLEIIFALTKGVKSDIFTYMRLNFCTKKSRQPLTAWSAGCAFKNPPGGVSAGKLLELAGFRGRRLGGMAYSPMHANFLVNEGTGDSRAAFDLLFEAMDEVSRKFGVRLEPEVRIVPWPLP